VVCWRMGIIEDYHIRGLTHLGTAGAITGFGAAIIGDASPVISSIMTGTQWTVLGTTYWCMLTALFWCRHSSLLTHVSHEESRHQSDGW
jgi:hypothetical protein